MTALRSLGHDTVSPLTKGRLRNFMQYNRRTQQENVGDVVSQILECCQENLDHNITVKSMAPLSFVEECVFECGFKL